ncbi:hypothetical protein ScPMuIL_015312 [Solemya velum]
MKKIEKTRLVDGANDECSHELYTTGITELGQIDDVESAISQPHNSGEYDNKGPSAVGPVTLTWTNLNASLKSQKFSLWGKYKEEDRVILKQVSGTAESGSFLAILGASGAGKTTLLNVLTQKNIGHLNTSGEIKANCFQTGRNIRNISCYVQQEDLWIGALTVREHLRFRALLRMDTHIQKAARFHRVEDVIHELGLGKCADTYIQLPSRSVGISGGERKRLSIASEILTNTPLMFCDEPTSGLDFYNALSVVKVLKKMAEKGHTILCTVHQPSSQIYATFDRILLIADGKVAYTGSALDALTFFAEQGYRCPSNCNPADYFIQALAVIPGEEEECNRRLEIICDGFQKNSNSCTEKLDGDSKAEGTVGALVSSTPLQYRSSWGRQLTTLTWRTYLQIIRDPSYMRFRCIQIHVVSILFGLIYFQQKYNQEGIMNINGCMFLLILIISFNSVLTILDVFPSELQIFLREFGLDLYRVETYFLSKTISDLPYCILIPFTVTTIIYWMAGFRQDAESYLIAAGVAILVANAAVSLGYMISSLARNTGLALSMSAPVMMPLVLFGGPFLNNGTIRVYFVWLEYLSWYRYAYELLVINQWEGITSLECDIPVPIANQSLLTVSGSFGSRCFKDGDEIIQYFHYDKAQIRRNIGLLFTLIVGFRILALLFLWIRTRRSSS